MKRLEFNMVIGLLHQQRDMLLVQLKEAQGNNPALIDYKSQIDAAIATLSFCEKYQLSPLSDVRVLAFLPNLFNQYGLIELDEMDRPPVRPLIEKDILAEVSPYSLIVKRPVALAKYYIDEG